MQETMGNGVKILRALILGLIAALLAYYISDYFTKDLRQQGIEEISNSGSSYQNSDYSDSYNNNYNHYEQKSSYDNSYQYNAHRFTSSQSVLTYLSSRKYASREYGTTVKIRYDGIYADGECLTMAPTVVEYEGTRAVVTARSPYGTKITFMVDTEECCIWDKDNVYYEK